MSERNGFKVEEETDLLVGLRVRLDGARAGFERALAIMETRLPADHPHITITRRSLERMGWGTEGGPLFWQAQALNTKRKVGT